MRQNKGFSQNTRYWIFFLTWAVFGEKEGIPWAMGTNLRNFVLILPMWKETMKSKIYRRIKMMEQGEDTFKHAENH